VYTDSDGGTVVSENLRAGSGTISEKAIYAVHAALGLTVSDVMLQGCQVVIVEGVSDQYYLTAIKNVLIREKKIAPKREIVFAPAGGVKGVAGIAGLISTKDNDLPYVLLDSDKSGDDYKKKLVCGQYQGHEDLIICIKDIIGIDQTEVEDLIPFDLISRAVEKLLGVQDEEDEFEPQDGKPIIPQIENYASERGIVLSAGWKVNLARSFKRNVTGSNKRGISDEYIKRWTDLFEKIGK